MDRFIQTNMKHISSYEFQNLKFSCYVSASMHMYLFNLLQLSVTIRVETSSLIWNQMAGFYKGCTFWLEWVTLKTRFKKPRIYFALCSPLQLFYFANIIQIWGSLDDLNKIFFCSCFDGDFNSRKNCRFNLPLLLVIT